MNRLQALFIALLLLTFRTRCAPSGSISDSISTDRESDLTDNSVADTGTINGEGEGGESDIDAAADEAGDEFDKEADDQDMDQALEDEDAEEDQGDEADEEPMEEGEAGEPESFSSMEGQMLNPYDPNDQLTKFFGISKALKRYEDTYINCFDELPDPDFIQSELDKCTGVDFVHVHNALDYERRKVVSWADKSMHKVMIDHCYEGAGEDETLAEACDLFKDDLLTLLWNNMPMRPLLEMHTVKYLRDRATMDPVVFQTLLGKVSDVEEEFDSLIDEVELHRENTVNKIKTYIRRRVEDLQDRFNRGEYSKYPKMKKDLIEWTERMIETPDYTLDMAAVGRKLVKETGKNEGVGAAKKEKTRNFQKAFISDWVTGGKGVERALMRKKPVRPAGVRDEEVPSQNLLEKSALAREKNRNDRFQYFNRH